MPSQGDVIARTVELVAEFVTRRPDTAVLVGAYSVGKERIFKALAKAEIPNNMGFIIQDWDQPCYGISLFSHKVRVIV